MDTSIAALIVSTSGLTWLFLAKLCLKIGEVRTKIDTEEVIIKDHENRIRKIEELRW